MIPTSNKGAVSIRDAGVVAVNGMEPGSEATVTITATKTGFQPSNGSVTGSSKNGDAVAFNFVDRTSTHGGFTVRIGNYEDDFNGHTINISDKNKKKVSIKQDIITVTNLEPNKEYTVNIVGTKKGFNDSKGSITERSLPKEVIVPKAATDKAAATKDKIRIELELTMGPTQFLP